MTAAPGAELTRKQLPALSRASAERVIGDSPSSRRVAARSANGTPD
jgi:hypothetical protein